MDVRERMRFSVESELSLFNEVDKNNIINCINTCDLYAIENLLMSFSKISHYSNKEITMDDFIISYILRYSALINNVNLMKFIIDKYNEEKCVTLTQGQEVAELAVYCGSFDILEYLRHIVDSGYIYNEYTIDIAKRSGNHKMINYIMKELK